MGERLLENRLFSLELDGNLVRLVRTSTPLADLTEFQDLTTQVRRALGGLHVRGVLVDLRAGPPGRNDPEFEAAGSPWRRLLRTRFDRMAVLVRTQAGRLQTQRIARQDGREAHVFLDEAEALRYLNA
jgi:hypothetical protein